MQGGAVGFHALPPLEESRLVELTRGVETSRARRRTRGAVLPVARQARRMGRGRSGPGPGPDRVPARERGRLRGRRGSRHAGGRRHRHAPRLQLPARPARMGGHRSSWTTCCRRWTRCTKSSGKSATAPRHCCAGWSPRAARRGDRQRLLRVRLKAYGQPSAGTSMPRSPLPSVMLPISVTAPSSTSIPSSRLSCDRRCRSTTRALWAVPRDRDAVLGAEGHARLPLTSLSEPVSARRMAAPLAAPRPSCARCGCPSRRR